MEQLVPDALVKDLGNHVGAQALDLVGSGLALAQQRGLGGLDAVDLHPGLLLAQYLAHSGQRAPGADAGHEDVDVASGLLQDLPGRGLAVNLGVGRVGELGGEDRVGGGGLDLLGPLDRSGYAALGGQYQLRSEGAHDGPALLGHGLGHGDDDLVSQGRSHHGQADAGVPGGRLHDGATGLEVTGGLRGAHDGQGDAVLDRGSRLEGLHLGQDGGGGAVGDAVDADQGSVADQGGCVGCVRHSDVLRVWVG